jgi:hypothetical protein
MESSMLAKKWRCHRSCKAEAGCKGYAEVAGWVDLYWFSGRVWVGFVGLRRRKMSESVEAAVHRVEGDALCRRCGYNLRGLEVAGTCPECRAAVEHSIHGDLLRYSSVAWLEKVRQGFTWVLWGIVVQIVGGVVGGIASVSVWRGNQTLSEVWALAVGLVSMVGMWWITERDPADQFTVSRPRNEKARQVVRVMLVATVALAAAQIGCSPGVVGRPAAVLSQVVSILEEIASLVGVVAQLAYIAGLADRIPHLQLAAMSRGLRTAYGITMGAMVVLAVVISLIVASARGGMGGGAMAVGCGMGLLGLALLVIAVLQVVLLVRMRKQMRGQVELAEVYSAAAGGRQIATLGRALEGTMDDSSMGNG